MQLPWRPGWRTLVTGHGFGGNTLTATSYLGMVSNKMSTIIDDTNLITDFFFQKMLAKGLLNNV